LSIGQIRYIPQCNLIFADYSMVLLFSDRVSGTVALSVYRPGSAALASGMVTMMSRSFFRAGNHAVHPTRRKVISQMHHSHRVDAVGSPWNLQM
jgi:hypothetical protein